VPEAPPLHLGDVTVRLEGGDAALDEAGLAQRLRAQFQGSGLAIAGGPDGGAAVPTVRIAGRVATEIVETENKGLCRAAVSLAITTRPSAASSASSRTPSPRPRPAAASKANRNTSWRSAVA